MPWPVKLGLRAFQVRQAFPLVDRIVLVPDGATYLDELSKWSPAGRWPVLFEDDRYAPMFVRAFKPKEVIRRTSVGRLPDSTQEHRRLMEALVIRAFGGDPAQHTVRETFDQQGYAPPGVVITSTGDPAWTAAAALAAGRGQPLAWMDEPYGRPNAALSDGDAHRLIKRVDALVKEAGYPCAGLGDQIDAITICRDMAGKADLMLPPEARLPIPPPHAEGPVAITDLLGRDEQYARYACTGWIFGEEVRSAYTAMCSLFLSRVDFWLCNTYPDEGFWSAYGIDGAAEMLSQAGFRVSTYSGQRASAKAWLGMLPRGFDADVLAMNTKGGAASFDMFNGTVYANDVPLLKRPLALHFVHSWSMRSPTGVHTVGGRWLQRGVYAYVGSAHEPLLGAFMPPDALVRRLASFVPLLVAARHLEGPFARPWRVNTYGDPLMLIAPPGRAEKPRVEIAADYGTDLSEHAKAMMRRIAADPDEADLEAACAQAARDLELLGRDDVLARLWTLARQQQAQAVIARPALGALFRRGDVDAFLEAWGSLPARDATAVDMLWHLLTPRLGPGMDENTLYQLQSSVRPPSPQNDLRRLAPHLSRAFGREHVQRVIQRELEKATGESTRKALTSLLEVYRRR